MKHSLITIILIMLTVPSAAQWKNANFGNQVLAFGVHDTNLFLSAPSPPNHLVYHCVLATPNVWFGADNGMDPTQGNVTSFASLGNYFFAGMTLNGGPGAAYRSTNNGSNWVLNAGGYVCSNGTYLFCVSDGIYQSKDSGNTNTWNKVTTFPVTDLAAMGKYIFASTSTEFWRSTDSGNTWSQLFPPFSGTMTVMGSQLFLVSGIGKLAESTDSGTQWSTVTVDSGSVPKTVNCLATDGKNLFVGTPTGVLVSTDTGKDWVPQSDSIAGIYLYPRTIEDVIQIGVFDTFVFADVFYTPEPGRATSYYLMYRPISELTKSDTTEGIEQQVQAATTLSVYPNPLTNTATITYTLAEDSRVNITIVDALGKTVSIPVPDFEETSGEHEITFDAQALPSGTYWCHLSAGSAELSAKLVISK
jgi:hypothetical protein